MLKKLSYVFITVAVMALTGCATGASVNRMVYNHAPTTRPKNVAFVHGITVNQVTGGQETNPLGEQEISNENFSAALVQSLKEANLYADAGEAKYVLDVTLLDLQQPIVAISPTAVSQINYTLKAARTHKVVYDKTITASSTAPFNSGFIFETRVRKAIEGAAQANIKKFIGNLYRLPAR